MESATATHAHDHSHAGAEGGQSLNRLAASATLHCLTGCATGEVVGMALATALGWSNGVQLVVAITLAYSFGFALTAYPLVKAGLPRRKVLSTAFASDTVSITVMEVIDNLTVVLIPGAYTAGLGDFLFWGSIALGFAIAFPFAMWVNRYLLARGKGHALVHEYHHAH